MPRHEEKHYTAEELKVLSYKEMAKLLGISVPTAKRTVAVGNGPRMIQVSARRVGFRVIDIMRWQEARMRP
jgi:predicted DNA-binding transcriptional regulator AlpA